MSFPRFLLPLLIATLPLSAQIRERAVQKAPATVTVTGVVRDASGAPVAGAIVHSGTYTSNPNGTAADGKYSINLPTGRPVLVTVDDFAFEPVTVTFTPSKTAMTLDLQMTTPHPTVTVKLSNGDSHVLDLGTSQFGYYIPLSGYARFDNGNFCKPDGSAFSPSKNDIAKIVGPATSVNFSPCCSRGAVLTVNVQMKSGEQSAVYFNDSCFGSEVDFIGRERSTGQWMYLNFANIAEIDFQ
ncbi:MAG TPA: carboxypeptidase-like regulatory domain-containing protein [Thermoanaerobaculia bacterium]|nr:carboxypeptidase-like regulatory domain-containing protein [Thermoanaerobaculia bacterium]